MRTLYECYYAKVREGRIVCDKGHRLPNRSLWSLERGAPLAYKMCQDCREFARIEKPLAPCDRGWRKQIKVAVKA